MQNKRIGDIPPQLKLIVVLGLQYAVLAKKVKGVYDEIFVELRAVMFCPRVFEGSNPGTALTIDASRKEKMKPEDIILRFLRSRMGAKN